VIEQVEEKVEELRRDVDGAIVSQNTISGTVGDEGSESKRSAHGAEILSVRQSASCRSPVMSRRSQSSVFSQG